MQNTDSQTFNPNSMACPLAIRGNAASISSIFDHSTNFKGYNLSDKPGAAGLSPTGKTEQVSIL